MSELKLPTYGETGGLSRSWQLSELKLPTYGETAGLSQSGQALELKLPTYGEAWAADDGADGGDIHGADQLGVRMFM